MQQTIKQLPPPPADPCNVVGEEVVQVIYDSGNPATGAVQWCNESGRDFRVVRAQVWTGAAAGPFFPPDCPTNPGNGRGAALDLNFIARRHSDNALLIEFNQDRYDQPNNVVEVVTAFPAGTYLTIAAGDGIDCTWYANNDLGIQPPPNVQNCLRIWGVYGPG